MISFGHEIPCPDDRAMRKFLWFDYFHDSDILRVEQDVPAPGDITLTLRSCRDTDEIYEKLHGTPEEQRAQFEPLLPRVTYLLRFHNARHFRHVMEDSDRSLHDVINGRFRDTPLKRRLEREWGSPLYHLRLHTGCGMMDIVFERFSIRRMAGRVDYRCDWDVRWNSFDDEIAFLADYAVKYPDTTDEDDLLCVRLYRLYHSRSLPELLSLARQVLPRHAKLGLAPAYAAMLLGLYGDVTDVPDLTRVFLHADLGIMARQHAQDAMERIAERRAAHD